jgi:hypothetical protein
MTTPLLDAALDYASRGWRVVPLHSCTYHPERSTCSCHRADCTSQGKHPRLRDWVQQSSADSEVVRHWWDRWPMGNVGIALGSRSGIVAVDIDPPGGEQALLDLSGGDLPETLELMTGKGRRLIYTIPDGITIDPETRTFQDANGDESIRLQSTGGQCVMPPSQHPSGRVYQWVEGRSPAEIEPAPMPGWMLVEMCRPKQADQYEPAASKTFVEGGSFNTKADWWRDILEPSGWRRAGSGTNATERYTRPGKQGGISATVGHYRAKDGTPALYVFSGSVAELPAGKCYDKFGAYTRLFHGGDFQRASDALAQLGYGSPRRAKANTPGQHIASGQPRPAPSAGITAAELVKRDFPPPRWCLEGVLPEGLTILGGRPKQGKSWLSLLIGWVVAGGIRVDGRSTTQGPVLYLALEDTLRRLKSRIETLHPGLGWEPPEGLTLHTSWPRTPDGLEPLQAWLQQHKDAANKLVIVDTLAKFRAPQKGNGNSYADDYEALGAFKGLLDQHSASGIVVHHTRKLKAEDPFDELSGTQAIAGAADTIWILDRDRGSDQARLYVTGRDVPDSTIPLTFVREHCRWQLGQAIEGIETGGRVEADHQFEKCMEWIKVYLKDFAYPDKEVMDAASLAGFGFKTYRTAKERLGKSGSGELRAKKIGFSAAAWWIGLGDPEQWTHRPTTL